MTMGFGWHLVGADSHCSADPSHPPHADSEHGLLRPSKPGGAPEYACEIPMVRDDGLRLLAQASLVGLGGGTVLPRCIPAGPDGTFGNCGGISGSLGMA